MNHQHLTTKLRSDEHVQPAEVTTCQPSLSVIVCAYTDARIDLLSQCLDALLEQLHGNDELVAVIDYNEPLFDIIAARYAGRVSVLENQDRKGLSGARNSGIRFATSDVVAFVDDDAQIQTGWADLLRQHFADTAVAGVGGYAHPVWPADERPYWFPVEYDWVVGCSHRGLPRDVAPVRNFIGCNMAFRRSIFDAVGDFNTDMGRVGTRPVGCEETELCIRVSQQIPEARMLIDPQVSVRHWVSCDRARMRYFVGRCFGEGISKQRLSGLVGTDDSLSSERHYVATVLPTGIFAGINQVVAGKNRIAGLARIAAILLGLVVTAAGFLYSALRSFVVGGPA